MPLDCRKAQANALIKAAHKSISAIRKQMYTHTAIYAKLCRCVCMYAFERGECHQRCLRANVSLPLNENTWRHELLCSYYKPVVFAALALDGRHLLKTLSSSVSFIFTIYSIKRFVSFTHSWNFHTILRRAQRMVQLCTHISSEKLHLEKQK